MPARPELVDYLRANLKDHPAEALKAQLAQEGVNDADFQAALAEAKKPRPRNANPLAMALAGGGIAVLAASGLFYAAQKPSPAGAPSPAEPSVSGESGFVGHYGYVVRLPRDYAAIQSFKDSKKTEEVVHFAKTGTDPTSLLDEGLYGPMGIVRLDVAPHELAGYTNGLDVLTKYVSARAKERGEKFTVKNFQVSSLHGVQFTYDIPFARVEAFILGRKVLYTLHAGQDDEVFRDILNSLRETASEQ